MEYTESNHRNISMTLLPSGNNTTRTSLTDAALTSPSESNLGIEIFSGIAMSLVIVITILGNLIVISAVLKFRSLRTMNNCFIVSLAVADLLVGMYQTTHV